ncbi:MAG: hypothetical protein JWQ14_2206 [Adhaeribacter sp.]|nr:hypothetical protein [Adhaeribacter sp.]
MDLFKNKYKRVCVILLIMFSTETVTYLDQPNQELELDFCSVLIYERPSFVHVIWSDGQSIENYRTNILQVLKIITNLKIKYLLSDANQIQLQDNNKWLLNVCVPLLIKSKLHKLARIVPYHQNAITLNQQLLEAKKYHSGSKILTFDFETFTDVDSAFHWLDLQNTLS